MPTSPPSPETAADRNVGSGRSASPAQRGHARKRKGPRPVKVRGRRVLESPTSHDFPGVGGVIRPESPDEQPRIPAPQHGRPRSPPGIGYREVRKEGPFAKPVFRAKLSAWQSPRIVPPGQEYNEIEIPKNSKRAEPGQRIGALNRESRVSPRAPLATARTAVTDIVLGSARRTLGMLSSRRRSDASEAITLAPLGARTLRTARTLNLSATAPAAPPRPGDLVSNSFTSLPGLIVPPGGPKLQTFGPAELAEKRRKAREAARRRRLLKQGIGKPTQADILSRRDPTPRDVEEGAADEGEQPPAGEAAVSARDTTAVAVRGSKSRKRRGARPTRERVLTGYLKLAYEAGLTQLAVSAGTTLDYLFLVATSPAKALPSVEAADEAEAADAVAAAAAQEASIEFAALMAVDKGKAAQLVDADENDGEGSVASLTDEQLAEKAAAEKAARDKALEKAREAAEAELEAKLESGKPKLKRATTVDLLTAEDVRGQFKRSKSRRRWPTEEEQKLEEKRRKVQAAGASERADAEARDAEDESDKPDDFTKLATRGAQPPSKAKIWRGPVFEGLIRAKATTRRIEVTRSIYAHGPPPTYYTKDEGLQIVLRRHHAAALKLQRLVRGNFARTRTTAIQTAVRAVADGGILYAAGHQLGKMVCVVTVRPDCLPAPAPPPATHNPQYVIAAVRVFAYDVTTQESTVMRVPAALVGTSADGTGYISGQDITAWFMDTRVEAYWQEPSPARIELTGNRSRFRLKVISRTASLKRIRENALDSMATPAQRATAKKQVYRGFHGLDGGLYGLCTLKRVVPADDVDPLTPLLLEMYAPAQQIALHIVFTHLDALLTEFQPVPFKSGFDAAKRLIDCRVVKRSILGVPKLIVRPPTEPMNRDLSRMLRRMRGRKLPNGQHQEGIYSSMHLINKRLTGVSIIGDTDPPRGKVLGEVTMLWIHVHDVAKNISGRISIQSDIALEGLGIHLHAKDRLIPAMFSYGLMARMIEYVCMFAGAAPLTQLTPLVVDSAVGTSSRSSPTFAYLYGCPSTAAARRHA